jgi:pimeloyl-ACP methyl ester carboxylesterase
MEKGGNMLKKLNRWLGVCACLLFLCSGLTYAYDYPFTDPYVATVLSTPAEFEDELPGKIPIKFDKITVFPDREIPKILWHLKGLDYSYLKQKGPARLIFLIAGTGASFQSEKMKDMQRTFYHAGYHVISLSSPTHPNFIVSASASGVPGHLKEDSVDLYRVMQQIWQKLQRKMEVTDFYLTGYSLGAAQSAFIAKIDEKKKAFNFRKVLLINPPVSLYNSVIILDNMLEQNIPGGLDNFEAFYEEIISAFTDAYVHGDNVNLNNNLLYNVYKYRKPKNDDNIEALIGLDFRLSSGNMVFASDVLTRAGYVIPSNLELGRHDSMTDYSKVFMRLSFLDYFKGIFLPHFKKQDPGLKEADLIQKMSLKHIENYLRTSPKLGLIHNEDDIILRPGEIDYLRDVFGSRAHIFPHGGHCGNMAYPDNTAAMIEFFSGI